MGDRLRLMLVFGLAAVALGSAGCGGGDESTSDASTLPKASFIKQGDKICSGNYDEREKLLAELRAKYFKNGRPPAQAQQEEILVDQIMPVFWKESDELNKLPLPEEGTHEAEKILTALEDAIKAVEANPTESLRQGTGVAFAEAEKLAHDFGFEWCGRS